MNNYLSILAVTVIFIGCQTQSIEVQAAGITLVRNGISRAMIAIAPDPDEHVQLAIKELQINLEKISGAKADTKIIKVDEGLYVASSKAIKKRFAVFV